MQLDQTSIVVRERDFPDLMDLAICVLRRHFWPLAVLTLVGCLPFGLVNYWMLADMIDPEEFDWGSAIGYIALMVILIDLEIPLATAPITLYLGQIVHYQQADYKRMTWDLIKSLPQMILLEIVMRGFLIIWLVTWFVPFLLWPYLNEVILLERNPLLNKRKTGTGTFSRNWSMHSRSSGTLMGRRLATLALSAALTTLVFCGLNLIRTLLWGTIELEDVTPYTVLLPIAMWMVAGFFTIVRFLSYLDLRIRHEAWEIELAMRVEGGRLARGLG